MNLPKKAIKEFRELWLEEFGEKISETKAEEEGTDLINLYLIFIKYINSPLKKTLPKN